MVGVVAGYAGRLWDEVLMRVADVLLSFPAMLLALLIISTLGSEGIYLILTIVVVFAPGIARVVRCEKLQANSPHSHLHIGLDEAQLFCSILAHQCIVLLLHCLLPIRPVRACLGFLQA